MTNYKFNEDKMFADISDGVAIIINSETGVYYGMNKLGTAVFEELCKGVSSEKIYDKIGAWKADAQEDFNKFMQFITEQEIVIQTSGQDDLECSINEAVAKEDDYILKADEYLDAQELLLADPIHEVKEEDGWTPEKSSLNEDKEDVARREAKMEVFN